MKSIIFDLDLTLVDSNIAEKYRKNRDWKSVYSLIPSFQLYDGMLDVFQYIREKMIKVCIVSTAPSVYINRVVSYYDIPCNHVVDFFSTKQIKPHPAPMLKALELLKESSCNVVSFGDRVIDIQASNSANIDSFACLWGTNEEISLSRVPCNGYLKHPIEILDVL